MRTSPFSGVGSAAVRDHADVVSWRRRHVLARDPVACRFDRRRPGRAGPPPWPESLKCAAHVQAWAELAKDANGGIPEDRSFDAAIFWSMAAMEAAWRDRVESPAEALLAACLDLTPR